MYRKVNENVLVRRCVCGGRRSKYVWGTRKRSDKSESSGTGVRVGKVQESRRFIDFWLTRNYLRKYYNSLFIVEGVRNYF